MPYSITHEKVESENMKRTGCSYEEAHEIAEKNIIGLKHVTRKGNNNEMAIQIIREK